MSDHSITADFLRRNPLPLPFGEVDKNVRGRVIVVGGNREVPGAVLLAAMSALRSGAGKVQIATISQSALGLGLAIPEARIVGLSENGNGDIDPENAGSILSR